MIAILSPAKNMLEASLPGLSLTQPVFAPKANRLAKLMKGYSPWELESLLKVNPDLALKAHRLFQDYGITAPKSPALLAYQGLAFTNLNAQDFDLEDFAFAQEHLRILSAFYGVLRPNNAVLPYRLEFLCRVKPEGKSLYAFWGDAIYRELFVGGKTIINLCSAEYVKTILPYRTPKDRIIACRFLVKRRGKLRCIATEAKMARGQMARYIIKNRLTEPERLKDFQWNGYIYSPALSGFEEFTFIQE